jgi:hypothetical protein
LKGVATVPINPNHVPGPHAGSLTDLLSTFVEFGASELSAILGDALHRAITRGVSLRAMPRVLDSAARLDVAELLAAVMGTSQLVGKAIAQTDAGIVPRKEAAGLITDLVPLPPTKAIQVFAELDPRLVPDDPRPWVQEVEQQAFRLARRTDKQVTLSVYDAVKSELETGKAATPTVAKLLQESGAAPGNAAYAEMVVRTNVMQSLNQGQQQEIATPALQSLYPVWQYHAIRDGRERKSHGARDGLYFPATATFEAVRGTLAKDVINCRCTFSWISRVRWKRLQESEGTMVQDQWV